MKTVKTYKIKIDNQDLGNTVMSEFTSIVVGDEILNVIFNSINDHEDLVICFLPNETQNKVLDLFIEYGVLESYFDITKDVLYQKETGIVLECPSEIKLVRDFINEFLDSDVVLDKINELGISSLTSSDYDVLERQNPH
jgi:hypothetical protein